MKLQSFYQITNFPMNICEQICNVPIQIGIDILKFSYIPMASNSWEGEFASSTFAILLTSESYREDASFCIFIFVQGNILQVIYT